MLRHGARARFRVHRRLPHLSVCPERHDPLCRSGRGAGNFVCHDFDNCHYDVVRYLTDMANVGLPVRHIEMTNLVVLDYDRSLQLSKVQAAGDAALLALTPVGRGVELSHTTA